MKLFFFSLAHHSMGCIVSLKYLGKLNKWRIKEEERCLKLFTADEQNLTLMALKEMGKESSEDLTQDLRDESGRKLISAVMAFVYHSETIITVFQSVFPMWQYFRYSDNILGSHECSFFVLSLEL